MMEGGWESCVAALVISGAVTVVWWVMVREKRVYAMEIEVGGGR